MKMMLKRILTRRYENQL